MNLTRVPELAQLLQRLDVAERELTDVLEGNAGAVAHPEGWTALLHEVQLALIESEAQAKENAAVVEAILASTPDTLLEVDAEGTIRFANKLFADAAGGAVIGRSWLDYSPAEQHEPMQNALACALANGTSSSFEYVVTHADGRVTWLSTRVSPVLRDGARVGAVVATRDVSSSKLAEAQLIAADRMAAIGLLAAGVAHEINNPLGSLVANLDLAVEDVASESAAPFDRQRHRDALRDAREGAERIRQIVQDIKVFSRSDETGLEAVDVESAVESALRMAWNEIRRRARLVKNYQHVPLVWANESRLGQVFLNLLMNAAQAIPEGNALGHVVRVTISHDEARGRVVVAIGDTGAGIPAELRARLFTPFFTTKPPGVGTGLGLSICKRIVDSLGGEITVESEVGNGTVFSVHLPLAPAGLTNIVSSPPPPLWPHRRAHVLIVDDDRLLGQGLVRALARHDVRAVGSAREALSLLTDGARFDVILCELVMPDMTGIEFFGELEARFPAHARRTVFTTAGVRDARSAEFLSAMPGRCLQKPVSLRTLLAVIGASL
jgi:PAS domain S-box-containing protein